MDLLKTALDTIKNALDKAVLFPAGALAAVTILLLLEWGQMPSLEDKKSWVAMVGIFCGWVSTLMLLQWAGQASVVRYRKLVGNRQSQAEEVAKLDILNDDQKHYLVYIRANELWHFQAWRQDEVLWGLRRMGLLREAEKTDETNTRYIVPTHIRRVIECPDWEPGAFVAEQAPWDWAREQHSRRYRYRV